MKIIDNLHPLGNWFVKQFCNYDGTSDTFLSASRIGSSPRKNLLYNRHQDNIEELASELYKAAVGTAMHETILELLRTQYPDSLEIEVRRNAMIGARKVSAKTDIFVKKDIPELQLEAGTVIDVKTPNYGTWLWTSDNHYIYRMQLLANAALIRQDYPVKKAALWFLFTDWTYYQWLKNQPDAKTGEKKTWPSGKDFPMGTELVYYSIDKAEDFVGDAVYQHELHANTPDDGLPPCGAQDTWEKPPWKVYGYTQKGAVRARCMAGGSFFSKEEAEQFASKKSEKTAIKHVPEMEKLGCQMCSVRKFCNQYKGGE